MKVQTARFGEIEVPETSVITFTKGLPGFEAYKDYVLFPADEKGETPFFFLQSVGKAEISFFLLDTFVFFNDYNIELDEQSVEKLGLEKPEDALILTTITVKGEIQNATTNLKAPFVINVKKQHGMQIVLEKNNYMIKQPLFKNNQKAVVGRV